MKGTGTKFIQYKFASLTPASIQVVFKKGGRRSYDGIRIYTYFIVAFFAIGCHCKFNNKLTNRNLQNTKDFYHRCLSKRCNPAVL